MSDMLSAIAGMSQIGGSLLNAVTSERAGNKAAEIQNATNQMSMNMANTAHQREVADLKAAGINPLLSAHGSGLSTPSLTAPTQGAEGSARAGNIMGNAMANLPATIIQLMSGQQQIELQRAQTDKTRAENEKISTETNKINTEIPWINRTNEQNISESKQRVTESSQRTVESQARTATNNAMRVPSIAKIVADIANTKQRTLTEEEKTKEQKEIANNAKQLYGSRASEAAIIAAQAATYYKNFFTAHNQQKTDINDLQIKLLKDQHFQAVIKNMLDNEYGRLERWSSINSNVSKIGAQLGATAAGNSRPVTKQEVPQ
ncbi:MAG: DNA pilot protein [Microvirus sp.]|nr:MAG: DNA pilot protein [Microvirus sp.]